MAVGRLAGVTVAVPELIFQRHGFQRKHAESIGRKIVPMRFRALIALVAVTLALPAYAQHGARGGFSSHSGMGGHAGFAGHPGFSGSRGFSRPAPPMRNGGLARPGFGRIAPPPRTGFRIPYQGRGFTQNRPPYRPGFGDRNRGWNRGRDHDRRHRPWVAYDYGYPGWLGYPYPYVIDPGFYNWGDSGDSNEAQGSAPSNYGDAPPYADYGAAPDAPRESLQAPPAEARQPYAGSISSMPEVQQPLTLIFKNGRAPEMIQNYMMSSRTLTDLDRQHYEQIPLDQIDVAATEQANHMRGVDFQIPSTSRE